MFTRIQPIQQHVTTRDSLSIARKIGLFRNQSSSDIVEKMLKMLSTSAMVAIMFSLPVDLMFESARTEFSTSSSPYSLFETIKWKTCTQAVERAKAQSDQKE